MKVGNYNFKANNLRDLCTSPEVNKWSEYKPLNIDTNFNKITVEQSRKLNCGISPIKLDKLLTSCINYPGDKTSYTPENIISDGLEWKYSLQPPYNQPPSYFPYRLDDFMYYQHESVGNDYWENVSYNTVLLNQLLCTPDLKADNAESTDYSVDPTNHPLFSMLYCYNGNLNRPLDNTSIYDPAYHEELDKTKDQDEFDPYIALYSIFDLSHMDLIKSSEKYWRWNVAVYLPDYQKWDLFDSCCAINKGGNSSVPSLMMNKELVRRMLNSSTKSFTCIPVLVKNRTFEGITKDTEIYSAPSGKPFTLTIEPEEWIFGKEPSFKADGDDILEVISYEPHGFHLVVIRDYREYNGTVTKLALIQKATGYDGSDITGYYPTNGNERRFFEWQVYLDITFNVLIDKPNSTNTEIGTRNKSYSVNQSAITGNNYYRPSFYVRNKNLINTRYWGFIIDEWEGNGCWNEGSNVIWYRDSLRTNCFLVNTGSTINKYCSLNRMKYDIKNYYDLWDEQQNRTI